MEILTTIPGATYLPMNLVGWEGDCPKPLRYPYQAIKNFLAETNQQVGGLFAGKIEIEVLSIDDWAMGIVNPDYPRIYIACPKKDIRYCRRKLEQLFGEPYVKGWPSLGGTSKWDVVKGMGSKKDERIRHEGRRFINYANNYIIELVLIDKEAKELKKQRIFYKVLNWKEFKDWKQAYIDMHTMSDDNELKIYRECKAELIKEANKIYSDAVKAVLAEQPHNKK